MKRSLAIPLIGFSVSLISPSASFQQLPEPRRSRDGCAWHRVSPLASALSRTMEIASIVSQDLAMPLIKSLTENGLPDDWNAFWVQRSGNLTNADRLVGTIEALGPTYVKFGQAIATRPDIIPIELADALCALQDEMLRSMMAWLGPSCSTSCPSSVKTWSFPRS